MKLWLKILLAALGGFGGGFATGFLVHKKMNDIQFEEVSEEDLDKLLAEMPPTANLAEPEKKESDPMIRMPKELPRDPDELRKALQGKTPYMQADDEKKQEYSKIWNTVNSYSDKENADNLPIEENEENESPKDDTEEFMENLAAEANDIREEPAPQKEPYLITLGEFYDERREYDKITLDWYDEDNVLLDEQEKRIPDPVAYVGCSMKELFGQPPADGDPDSRFVRNDRYGTDYEVIRHHIKWSEASGE